MEFRQRVTIAAVGLAAVLTASMGASPMVANAAVPTAVSAGTSAAADPGGDLDSLTVRPHGSGTGYDRDKFGIWQTIDGSCNAREEVLKRDGEGVEVDSECRATKGTWKSPYDGASWTNASDVDIDHVVPLKNAWVSGASGWAQDRRVQFGNDLTRPQLLAVTDNVNQEKSDSGPEEWKPSVTGYHCTYATNWITVKKYYDLSVTEDEKAALKSMIGSC